VTGAVSGSGRHPAGDRVWPPEGIVLHLCQDDAGDALLSRDPFALLLGMQLDQQIPMEKAFVGPSVLARRLGTDPLDPAMIAAANPQEFAAVMAGPPAVHRYHTSMAGRVQALAAHIVREYDGEVTSLWSGAVDGPDLFARVRALPGFGDQKARIFVALLGKQCRVTPGGWQQAAGDYGTPGFRSVADVTGPDSLARVREYKRAAKAAARAGAS
jgi:uncharacterized HhH-GPD family protein